MLQGQLDPVADERFARQQRILGGAIGLPPGMDQADARGIAPHQHGRAGHQGGLGAVGHRHAGVARGQITQQGLEIREVQIGIAQRLGQLEDGAVGLLPVDARQMASLTGGQRLEHHAPLSLHGGKLGRIPEQQQRGEDRLQIGQSPRIEHRGLVHQADVEGILTPGPADDEVRPPQTRRGQRGRDRAQRLMTGLGPVELLIGQGIGGGTFAFSGQPAGHPLIGGVIDGGVENAVDRGRGHAARAQHGSGLVGGGQNGQAAPVPLAPTPIGRSHRHTRLPQPPSRSPRAGAICPSPPAPSRPAGSGGGRERRARHGPLRDPHPPRAGAGQSRTRQPSGRGRGRAGQACGHPSRAEGRGPEAPARLFPPLPVRVQRAIRGRAPCPPWPRRGGGPELPSVSILPRRPGPPARPLRGLLPPRSPAWRDGLSARARRPARSGR